MSKVDPTQRRQHTGFSNLLMIASLLALPPLPLAASPQATDRHAFSQPSANLPAEKKIDFAVGRALFEKLWVTAPSSTQISDGLGPLYNARSCASCHINNGRGHVPVPDSTSDNSISMTLRLSIPPQTDQQQQLLNGGKQPVIAEPVYGRQLQEFAIPGQPAEGKLEINFTNISVTLADGEKVQLRQPEYQVSQPGYGALHAETMTSARIAPAMIGLGLLEAIDEQDLISNSDPDDLDGDGISGRLNLAWSQSEQKFLAGRFGWKAAKARLDDQNQQAFNDDIGLSTPLHATAFGECTEAQNLCLQAPNGNSPQYANLEVHQQLTDLVLLYSRNLAVPAQRKNNDPAVRRGEQLFDELGCSSCHQPRYTTGQYAAEPRLAKQHIAPYTDLLLHDMGEGLADHRPEGMANGREWKTPPLWGIGLTKTVSGYRNLLHDGRARTVQEAILWHAGEAEASKQLYSRLPRSQRSQLIQFVESI